MKRFAIAAMAAVMLTFTSSNAFALLSVSADIPVMYSFKDAPGISESPATGLLLKLSTPIFLGLGLENYTVKPKTDAGAELGNYKVTMYDLYIGLPIPFVNVNIGVGVGKGDLTPPTGSKTHDPALLTQYFVSLGYPFLGIMDVHVGMYDTKGNLKTKTTGLTDINVSSTMYTLGVLVGF